MISRNICPHCGGAIKICVEQARVEFWEESEAEKRRNSGVKDPLHGLTERQRLIVTQFETNGLMERFRAIVQEMPAGGRPAAPEPFLFTWLRTLAQKVIPRDHLEEFLDHFGRTEPVEIWAAQGIGAVIRSGKIIELFPTRLVTGIQLRSLGATNGGVRMAIPSPVDALRTWLKTRRGYVPAECKAFLSQLRSIAIGELDHHIRLTTGQK